MSQESFYYELYTDFECISDSMRINLMRLRKDGNSEEFEGSMRLFLKVKNHIDSDYEYVDELKRISPRWRIKYRIKL